MKVQRIRVGERVSWTVLDNQHLPVAPIDQFLQFLDDAGRSPNTVRAYAQHLLAFWNYCEQCQLDWQQISIAEMAGFMQWLRQPHPDVRPPARQPSTIDAMVSGVIAFYQFHERLGAITAPPLSQTQSRRSGRYKPFLAGIASTSQTHNPITPAVPKREPPTLTAEQVQTLIAACGLKRDQFLLALLYQTGMRIGQALGLRVNDVEDGRIRIVPRNDNANGMRAKTETEYVVYVSEALMAYYENYLMLEYLNVNDDYDGESDTDNDYVVLSGSSRGQPLTYSAVTSLFRRLAKKTGIVTHPHVFRHTHVTELLKAGVDLKVIQERVGHKSIQTTMDAYAHLTDEDFAQEIQKYLHSNSKENDETPT
jgi:integrase/recombinase XerD